MRRSPLQACRSFGGIVCAASFALAASCSAGGGPASSLFVVPASLDALAQEHFYDQPWPSDLRRNPDGSVHLRGFYDPHQTVLLTHYIDELEGHLDGFSPAAMGYMRFEGSLDPGTLDGAVRILDVDPASPERGRKHPVQIHWQEDAGVYWLPKTLAVGPALGAPLRARTRYAMVVTKDARGTDGSAVTPSADLEEVLGVRPPTARTQAAHDAYAPAVTALAAAGIAPSDIAHLTVFTTSDPTAELFAVADDVHAHVPAPTVHDDAWKRRESTAAYDVVESVYGPSPIYQSGTAPYLDKGGDFVFSNGAPQLQSTTDLRITLVLPNAQACPMPDAGYPIVLYAHGTGGDYRSIVEEKNSVGEALAERCLASLGFDQMFHGTRLGAPPADDTNLEGDIELLFFNFANPHAMRTNNRQSAIYLVQMARLFTETHAAVPARVAGRDVRFDGSKLLFVGHSQGGQNGPLFLSADAQARGGVLSGASVSVPITLTEKTLPTPSVAAAFRTLLALTHEDEAKELTLVHPVLSLAQLAVDPTDPLNYAGYQLLHPRAGVPAKSVLLTEGVRADGTGDSYAPPHGIEVAAVAAGVPRIAPGTHAIAEATLADITIPADGLPANLAGGSASGALAQFLPPPSDGHFVLFDVPAARAFAADFCRNLADSPAGRLPALR